MARRIKAKLILRLRSSGLLRNAIASAQKMAKQSAFAAFDAADALGVAYDDIAGKDYDEVYRLLLPERNNHVSVFTESDWERVRKELGEC